MSGSAVQSKVVVRATPYGAQKSFIASVVANNGTLIATFDIASVISDRNQLQAGFINSLPTVGPYLDVLVFSDSIGTLDVLASVDAGGLFRTLLAAPLAVAVSTYLPVNGLRIPSRYIEVLFTNTSGGNATVDFGAYVRSN